MDRNDLRAIAAWIINDAIESIEFYDVAEMVESYGIDPLDDDFNMIIDMIRRAKVAVL